MIDRDLTKEPYIPNARDAVVAFCGWTDEGTYRAYCVTCHDKTPLKEHERGKIYGDLYVSEGPLDRVDDGDRCDRCGVTFLSLSQRCQAEHDEQQRQWARYSRPTVLIEYGIPGAIRCRVY